VRAAAEAEDEEEDDADDEDEDEDDEDDEEADAEDDAGAVVAAADEDDEMDADEEETEEEDDDDEDEEEDAAVRAASWCRNTAVLTCSPASTSKLGPNTFFHSAICPLRAWARACSSIACSNLDLAASTAIPSMATRAGHR